MKTNRHGLAVIQNQKSQTQNNSDWTYSVEDILLDAFDELGVNLKRRQNQLNTQNVSVNTRSGVPSVPTFKGVRFLGTLPFHKRMQFRLQNFGHNFLKTGVFAR